MLGEIPLDLLLGLPVVPHQSLIALLQIPGGYIKLLIHFGVLVIHLAQQVHLLGQVLVEKKKKKLGNDGEADFRF